MKKFNNFQVFCDENASYVQGDEFDVALYKTAVYCVKKAIDDCSTKTITSIAEAINVHHQRMARLLDTLDLRIYLAEAKRGKK